MSSPELDQIGAALVRAAGEHADSTRRLMRYPVRAAFLSTAALSMLGASVAIAGVVGIGPFADSLNVFTRTDAVVSVDQIPASAKEVATQTPAPAGEPAPAAPEITNARLLLSNQGSHGMGIYAFPSKDRVCIALGNDHGAVGSCAYSLGDGKKLTIEQSVDDGVTYVWGLAADDVTAVTVTADGRQLAATVGNNAFFVELPASANNAKAMSVDAATKSDGAVHVEVPGIPKPAAPAAS